MMAGFSPLRSPGSHFTNSRCYPALKLRKKQVLRLRGMTEGWSNLRSAPHARLHLFPALGI
jgi:hypothetical protein